jgi:hypothetical protein
MLGLTFSLAVILAGLWVGLTPRQIEQTLGDPVRGEPAVAVRLQCGSPLHPAAGRSSGCSAVLDSRRELAFGTLAIGVVSLIALPLLTRHGNAAGH